MTHSDPIADLLTRLRNAMARQKDEIILPASRVKLEIAKILKQQGFIEDYTYLEQDKKTYLRVELKYLSGTSAIQGLKRVSRPGRREYVPHSGLIRHLRPNHTTIISTSRGLMTTHEARQHKLGGEVVCSIW